MLVLKPVCSAAFGFESRRVIALRLQPLRRMPELPIPTETPEIVSAKARARVTRRVTNRDRCRRNSASAPSNHLALTSSSMGMMPTEAANFSGYCFSGLRRVSTTMPNASWRSTWARKKRRAARASPSLLTVAWQVLHFVLSLSAFWAGYRPRGTFNCVAHHKTARARALSLLFRLRMTDEVFCDLRPLGVCDLRTGGTSDHAATIGGRATTAAADPSVSAAVQEAAKHRAGG